MKSNHIYLMTILAIFAAFIPTLLLRDLSPLNELNYLAIAQDALDRGTFFAFYDDGNPYADKPPSYLWICMIAVNVFGSNASTFLLLFSVLPWLYILVVLDRTYGIEFRHQERLLIIIGMCSLLYMDILSVVGRMDMLFSAAIVAAYVQLMKRYAMLQERWEELRLAEAADKPIDLSTRAQILRCKYGNLSIPLLIFLGIFIKGPYALIFPLLALLMAMAYQRELKRYFKVVRPYYFAIMLLCALAWAGCVYIDGGKAYLEDLFIKQSAERLSGKNGHPEPFYYYIKNFPILAMPIFLCVIYFVLYHIRTKHVLTFKQQSCAFFALSVYIVISIPSSKLEIYAAPAIPFLFYYVVLSYRQIQMRAPRKDKVIDLDNLDQRNRRGVEIVGNGYFLGSLDQLPDRPRLPKLLQASLLIPLLFYIALLPTYFMLYNKYTIIQHPLIGIGFGVLSFSGLVAVFMLFSRLFLFALSSLGLGTLGFVFFVGLAMPHINAEMGFKQIANVASTAIDRGGSNIVCAIRYRDAGNMRLFDPRFNIVTDISQFEQCLENKATILFSYKGVRDYPELVLRLKDKGAYMVGNNLVLPAEKPKHAVQDLPVDLKLEDGRS